ncbi:MAG: pyridoxal phosphate-dependent aminotransferase [Deltaproteobacteria bacterium]|nr:pyridoxal phosphate-dependent aminotransferase [Deltaproteobacteria bacterium]
MHLLAKRLAAIKPSATAMLFGRAIALRAQGVDLISFAVGEPDFDTPRHIQAAAKAAIDSGAFRYTAVSGIRELRDAISYDSKKRRGGIEHAADEIVVSVGAKHALFNLALTLLDPDDEVIIPTPSYVSYPEQVRLCGAVPLFIECSEDQGFLLSPEALKGAISEKTKALVLCSPSNPTGATYSARQLGAIAEVARAYNFWIIVDEIYSRLIYDGFEHRSLLEVAPDLRDRIAVVDGVSKTYAMTGWRIGWVLAPRAVARACEALQSQSTTNPTTVSQHAAVAALLGPQEPTEHMRKTFESRRNRLVEGINGIGGLSCLMPTGAFYIFVNVSGLLGKSAAGVRLSDDAAVSEWLLQKAKVAVVPGSAFGAAGYIRLSYAVSLELIDKGLKRIADAVKELS